MGRFSTKRNDPGPYSTQKKDQQYEEEQPMGHFTTLRNDPCVISRGRVISLHIGTVT